MRIGDRVALRALTDHLVKERDFNEGWIALHERDGEIACANRRREVVAEREGWLRALRNVLEEAQL